MGIYNYVDFKMACPDCGAMIEGFQTKDGEIKPLCLEKVSIQDVRHFYSFCEKCNLWIGFSLKKPQNITLDDFEMKIRRASDESFS